MYSEADEVFDVAIIGAGPCGLALAARLCEKTPAALFTDSEHQRYHWIKKDHARRNSKPQKATAVKGTGRDRLCPGSSNSGRPKMIVIDAHSDQWMHDWNERFEALGIEYLRSPMFFHPDPRDRDALIAYAWEKGRLGDLDEIPNVAGKELSKHQRKSMRNKKLKNQPSATYIDERDRRDYFRPPQDMFKEFCADVVDRYGIGELVVKAEVKDIVYRQDENLFTLTMSNGSTRRAKIVVLAIGSGLERRFPPDCPFSISEQQEGSIVHVFGTQTTGELPPHVLKKIKAGIETNLVVVGGGLTSAQITDTIAKSGVTKVHHLMRRPINIKQFDVDLAWAGKFRNREMGAFWSADCDEERLDMINKARNGGSITPQYFKKLQGHIKSNKVAIHQSTVISSGTWDPVNKTWSLVISSTSTILQEDPTILSKIDHVIYATGMPANLNKVQCLSSLIKDHPVRTVGGMPCLNDQLMWNDEVPLFVAGRLAGLRCGPWAGNLDGVRQSAERIAWKVAEFLGGKEIGGERRDSGYASEQEVEDVDLRNLGLGFGNSFGILGDSSTLESLL